MEKYCKFVALSIILLFVFESSNHRIIESSFAAEGGQQYLFQLSYNDAEQAISQALLQKGAGTRVAARINGDHDKPLFSYSSPISVQIRGLQFDKSGRWSANLLFVSKSNVISALPIDGHYQETVQVPVLKHEVRNGDVIGKQDIEVRDFPVTRIRTDTVISAADMVGKSPLFSISPERPVRMHELSNPAIVKKNNIVTMRFKSPGIEITATGQALDDGAKGNVIAVRNTVSRKIVHGVVADANDVNIVGAGESYAAN